MPISTRLLNATNKLESWMRTDALPLWTSTGINPDNGGVYEGYLPMVNPMSMQIHVQGCKRDKFMFLLLPQIKVGYPIVYLLSLTLLVTLITLRK